MSARITRIDIEGFRVIDKLSLELRPLNVLIGENGSGKSTVLEALELIRKAVTLTGRQFFDALYRDHDGSRSVRSAPGGLRFGVGLAHDDGSRHEYRFGLACGRDRMFRIEEETLVHRAATTAGGEPATRVVIARDRSAARLLVEGDSALRPIPSDPERFLLASWSEAHAEIRAVATALAGVEVFPAWPVGPSWASADRGVGPRGGSAFRPGRQLERDGSNLANVYQELRNQGAQAWQHTLDLVQLMVGPEVEDLVLAADPAGLRLSLSLRIRGVGEVPAELLSDGEIAILTMIAVSRLPRGSSLLVAFDEPELHLHPALVQRIAGLVEDMAEHRTVVLTTHSDRLLDALSDPADSVILFERGDGFATRAFRPDRDQLDYWLAQYAGLGKARAEGYGSTIFTEEVAVPPGAGAS